MHLTYSNDYGKVYHIVILAVIKAALLIETLRMTIGCTLPIVMTMVRCII